MRTTSSHAMPSLCLISPRTRNPLQTASEDEKVWRQFEALLYDLYGFVGDTAEPGESATTQPPSSTG